VNKALLDTDTLSDIRKGSNAAVATNAKTYRRSFGYYSLSAITVVEIVRGYQKVQQFQRLNAFLASLASEEVVSLDTSAAELAGRITGDLERVGQPIGRADPIIAAAAITQGLELVTGNTAH
jgi:tRNA(fMet)-specific endonuclease VapC